MPQYLLRRVTATEYSELIDQHSITEPIEQSVAWTTFDACMDEREHYGFFVFSTVVDGETQVVAVLSLTHFRGRGFQYLWAKKGPVWLSHPTVTQETALLKLLRQYVAKHDSHIVFIRLHCWYRRDDLHELLQTVTYDRTVVVDLVPTEEQILMNMKKRGRRNIKQAEKVDGLKFADVTGLTREDFAEYYAVYQETAQRDGFSVMDEGAYWAMLSSLGPEYARLFAVSRDNEILAWALVLVHKQQACAYYGASSEQGRRSFATDWLDWQIMRTLKEQGVRSYDLMGIDSERAPQLEGVTVYKTKFSKDVTVVAGAWDYPVHARRYRMLCSLMKLKRSAVAMVRQCVTSVRHPRRWGMPKPSAVASLDSKQETS